MLAVRWRKSYSRFVGQGFHITNRREAIPLALFYPRNALPGSRPTELSTATATRCNLAIVQNHETIPGVVADVRDQYPADYFFADFENSCLLDPVKRKHYRSHIEALMLLDDESWKVLKGCANRAFQGERDGQLKQPFLIQLNECLAYPHLCIGSQLFNLAEQFVYGADHSEDFLVAYRVPLNHAASASVEVHGFPAPPWYRGQSWVIAPPVRQSFFVFGQ